MNTAQNAAQAEEARIFEERAADYADKIAKYHQAEKDMKAHNESLQQQFKKQQEEVSAVEMENFKMLEELQQQEAQMAKI